MVKAYERTVYHGHTMNNRTKAMLQQAESYLGYDLTVLQGSYNGGSGRVSASAGTHDGGGAVDLAPAHADQKVRALRSVGFAAWHRPTLPDVWHEHIHCIAIKDKEMSSGAAKQVQDYYHHLNGLKGHAYDSSWRPNVIVPFQYPLLPVDASNCFAEYHKTGGYTAHNGVKRIQRALNVKTGTHLKVDGLFGDTTKQAFNRYSKQHGVSGNKALVLLGLALYKVKE